MPNSYIYIISNNNNSTLYIGMTSDLEKRIYQHQNKLLEKSFSFKYNLSKLLYWEVSQDIIATIKREKQLKKWNRDWKIDLIMTINPEMVDLSLYEGFCVSFGLKSIIEQERIPDQAGNDGVG
jgi:putative endonuclease